uniref:CBS domain-containing protein n=1 Tax=mine drainage metagenome TaxID=410659 RepID=E6QQM5_9ZZZZ
MEKITDSNSCAHNNEIMEVELSDADIIDAMQHISGYIDITTEDFRELYHLAYHHAIERLLTKIQPKNLMRVVNEPLFTDMPLDQAAAILIRSDFKSLPVLDENGCVVGILTDTDFLRWHKANTFLEILLNMEDNAFEFNHVYHEISVSAIMTAPAITVNEAASFGEIIHAFYLHDRRSMPIVDIDNHLLGLLMRKDFICAWKLITG